MPHFVARRSRWSAVVLGEPMTRAGDRHWREGRYRAREGLLVGVVAGALAVHWSRWLFLALLAVVFVAWAWDFWRVDV